MSETAPRTELMRSLGRLVRGLSAVFWGLPISLVICIQTANTNWLAALGPVGLLAPVAATSLLLYGLWLMGDFQRQERVWMLALDRARVLAIVNVGLSPFLHWHQQLPDVSFFFYAVAVMAVSSLFFLFNVNQVLQRLAAMLPDETLRVETRVFTTLNGTLLVLIPSFLGAYLTLAHVRRLPASLSLLFQIMEPFAQWVLFFLILLPTAVTMSLIWKIKEAILSSVFGPGQ
jgi:hypothetical protein